MGRVRQNRRRIVRENQEDLISRLPDDLIHLILSKIDLTQVIQTSQLSTRWRNLWKSLPHLIFYRHRFSRLPDFSKFITKFLSHRNPHSGISIIELKCHLGAIDLSLVKKMASYAASHNAQQIIISSAVSRKGVAKFPLSTFTCPSLQHLSLSSKQLRLSNKPAWNLPNLTSLILQNISFEFCCHGDETTKSVDLFSNLSNLKNLTIENCLTTGLKLFKITSQSLEHLTICFYWGQKMCQYVFSTPNLLSFNYHDIGQFFVPATLIRVGIDKKRNQLDLMIILLLSTGRLKSQGTKPYDEMDSPCKEITKLCNSPPNSSLDIPSSELMQVSSSFLASLFKCDLIPVLRPTQPRRQLCLINA